MSKQAERSRSQESLRLLAGQIARLPDAQPPPGLVDAIMGRIQPKKRPWWQIWMRRIQTPWAAVPLQAVPVAVAIILIVGGVAFFKGHLGRPRGPAVRPGRSRPGYPCAGVAHSPQSGRDRLIQPLESGRLPDAPGYAGRPVASDFGAVPRPLRLCFFDRRPLARAGPALFVAARRRFRQF